jgi:preprotein translocase subunit SecY
MEQSTLPSGESLMNRQTFGSLQHAPQLTHLPLRLLETGNIEVNVLFILASQVFLLSAINLYFPNDSIETIAFTNISEFC